MHGHGCSSLESVGEIALYPGHVEPARELDQTFGSIGVAATPASAHTQAPDDGSTGLEPRARLGTSLTHLPRIVVSADHGDDVRRAAADVGVHRPHKPLEPLALKSLTARLLAAS